MKEYSFKTDSGHNVILETEVSERYYFGLYITCDYTGWQKKWCPPNNLTEKDGNVIKSFSEKFDKICGVKVPEAIYSQIVEEYNKVRRNTGKLILATIKNKDKIVCQKIGYAIADVSFASYITYKMPKDMLDAILAYSKNGKIYDFGGLECSPEEQQAPFVYSDRDTKYWFEHFVPEDVFDAMLGDGGEKGETIEYELELRLVNPYK